MAASFLLRFVAALWHTTPLYFPDEYIYSGIARSLAESGKPLIRGSSAHFPALLEPLLAAPFWLTHDPALAYRLTQAENALAMSQTSPIVLPLQSSWPGFERLGQLSMQSATPSPSESGTVIA